MSDIRERQVSESSENERSRDSGYQSLIPNRRSRSNSPPDNTPPAAILTAEEDWRQRYQRHLASGKANEITTQVLYLFQYLTLINIISMI